MSIMPEKNSVKRWLVLAVRKKTTITKKLKKSSNEYCKCKALLRGYIQRNKARR